MLKTKTSAGFTLVELLIVIVVIAILAAISVVAYSGIQDRAHDSAVQSDLRQMAEKIQAYDAIHGSYPKIDEDSIRTSEELSFKVSAGSYDLKVPSFVDTNGDVQDATVRNILTCVVMSGEHKSFAIAAVSKSGAVFSYTKDGIKKESHTWVGHQSTACPRYLGIDYSVLSDSSTPYVRQFAYMSHWAPQSWRPGYGVSN